MERDKQIQGVVIGTRHFGELHKSVSILSPELGLISAVVYGGRKGKKTSLAPLFSFGTFQIYHNPVKNEYSVTEAEYSFTATKIMQDLVANCTASYFCEVASRIKSDSCDQVYSLLTRALSALEDKPENSRKILIDFTWKLLQISGVGSDFLTCPSCDRKYKDDEVLGFSSSMVTPVCKECSDSETITLLPGSRRYLMYTYPMTFTQALEVELYETAQIRLKTFLLSWITVFCQWPLKTVQSGLL